MKSFQKINFFLFIFALFWGQARKIGLFFPLPLFFLFEMAIELGIMTLYSQRPRELAHFLSSLLDMEMSFPQEGEGILLQGLSLFSSLHFLILERREKGEAKSASKERDKEKRERQPFLEFKLADLKELEDLFLKAQFLSYREGKEVGDSLDRVVRPSSDTLLFSEDFDSSAPSARGRRGVFFLYDLDGRSWKFSNEGN